MPLPPSPPPAPWARLPNKRLPIAPPTIPPARPRMKPPLLRVPGVVCLVVGVRWTGALYVRDLLNDRPPPLERASASSKEKPMTIKTANKKSRTGVNRFTMIDIIKHSFFQFSTENN